jgi:hypothetical protein
LLHGWLRPGLALGDQVAAGDEPVGEGDDLRGGAVVADEVNDGRPGVIGPELPQVLGRRAGEGVDGLPRVADHAQLGALPQPRVQQQLLQRVDVLELIDHEIAEGRVDLTGGGRLGEQDRGGQLEHRLEVEELPVPPGLLVGRV